MTEDKSPEPASGIHASGISPSKKKSNSERKKARAAAQVVKADAKAANRNKSTVTLVTDGPFVGMDKKELLGVILVWVANRIVMSKSFVQFDLGIKNAAGKDNADVAKSLENNVTLTLKDFKPDFHDPILYKDTIVTIASDGSQTFSDDVSLKEFLVKADELLVAKAVDNYKAYVNKSKCLYYRIRGQLDAGILQQLKMIPEWTIIQKNFNPVETMRLLHAVCFYGSIREYGPELVMIAVQAVLNQKQGKQSPSEFSDQTGSNALVLEELIGVNIWGQMPFLQKHVIDKCDDLSFEFDKLTTQSKVTQELVALRCQDVMLGCTMTVNSNKSKSDMYTDVKKTVLTNKEAKIFATDRTQAVDQMVGYEKLYAGRPNKGNNSRSDGDTSSAVILVGVPDTNTNDDATVTVPKRAEGSEISCWSCEEIGHSMYKCPHLSNSAKNELHQEFHANKKHSDPKKFIKSTSTINKAVMLHLGDSTPTAPAILSGEDDEDSNKEHDEESVFDTFCFMEVGVVHQLNDPDLRAVIIQAGWDVKRYRNRSFKVSGWTDAIMFKLNSIGIHTAAELYTAVNTLTLNSRLDDNRHAPLNSDTLIALGERAERYAEDVDNDEESFDHVDDIVDDLAISELRRIVRNVSIIQCMSTHKVWTDRVMKKLARINITSTTGLQRSIQYGSLNASIRNFEETSSSTLKTSTFNKATINGFRSELARARTGDRSSVPSPVPSPQVFCEGHVF